VNKTTKLIISLFFVFFIIFSYIKVFADVNSVDIVVTTSPENPKPYDSVNISLESYATDLDKSLIEWKGGSKTFLKNTGAKDFSFKMGGLGTQAILDVKIITEEGDTIQKRIVLTPTYIDMLWQATDSYVPPFYRGKALPAKEGSVKIVALPAGLGGIQTSNTTYTWKLNGETQQGQSGYKKNSFNFDLTTSELDDTVEVTSNTTSGNNLANGKIKISGINPFIIFYKKSPSDGILYNNALQKEIFMKEDDITLIAEPYFISDKNNTNDNVYSWKINDSEVETPAKRNILTIRPTARGGYAKINLDIENTLKLFQKVGQQLTIDL
jgi:hypothetical protein